MFPDNPKNILLNSYYYFVGYGNPESKYLFMGLEEKGKSEYNQIYINKFEQVKNYFCLDNEDVLTINQKYSKYLGFIEIINNKINVENVIQDQSEIGSRKKDVFYFNLYPLAQERHNSNLDNRELDKIGLTQKQYNLQIQERLAGMAEYLRKYFYKGLSKSNKKYLFCLGMTEWDVFDTFLKILIQKDILSEDDKFNTDKHKYFSHNNLHIIKLYHPRTNKIDLEELFRLIQDIEDR